MESVLPRIRISGSCKTSPKIPIKLPHKSERKKLVEAKILALSTSLPPSFLLILLPAPWPSINPKAWIIAIRANTTPVAPLALVPRRLTKKVSAILYTFVTSILIVVGSPNVKTSWWTGVFVILSNCSWALSPFSTCFPCIPLTPLNYTVFLSCRLLTKTGILPVS